jgi:hypothetical protein
MSRRIKGLCDVLLEEIGEEVGRLRKVAEHLVPEVSAKVLQPSLTDSMCRLTTPLSP